ncbi:sigma factor [Mycoplasma sp. P36-A1]|uniref:sigma factor n=1 Tax=Mycoplasma sp. P36-A1 TaxID=3252900 RepID=UPI003C2FDA08
MYNEYELLYYCHMGCDKSFTLLAQKYHRMIYSQINYFKKNYYFFALDEADLYNEALILLYDCTHSFDENKKVKFSSYFIACLRNRYIYMIRNLSSSKHLMHARALSLDKSMPDNESTMYSFIENGEICVSEKVMNDYQLEKSFKDLNNNLSEIEMKIVYLHILGYSYQEISDKTNYKLKKVDYVIQKYKKILHDSKI